jgi:hypothetical protein
MYFNVCTTWCMIHIIVILRARNGQYKTVYFFCAYVMKLDCSEGLLASVLTLCKLTLGNESCTADKLVASVGCTVN